MKVLSFLCIAFLLLTSGGCSDLLGTKELQDELVKKAKEEGVTIHLDGRMRITRPPLWVIDGEIWKHKRILNHELKPKDIKSVRVLKDQEALKKYGPKGKNGVVLIAIKDKAKH